MVLCLVVVLGVVVVVVVVLDVSGAVAVMNEVVRTVVEVVVAADELCCVVDVTSGGICVGENEGILEIVKNEDDVGVVGPKVPGVTTPSDVVGCLTVVF